MTYVAALLVFELFYLFYYLIPVAIVGALALGVSFILPVGEHAFQHVGMALLALWAIAAAAGSYRAKLAADAYGDRDMTMTEAHRIAGIVLRSHLSLLPVVGRIFESRQPS